MQSRPTKPKKVHRCTLLFSDSEEAAPLGHRHYGCDDPAFTCKPPYGWSNSPLMKPAPRCDIQVHTHVDACTHRQKLSCLVASLGAPPCRASRAVETSFCSHCFFKFTVFVRLFPRMISLEFYNFISIDHSSLHVSKCIREKKTQKEKLIPLPVA